MNETSELTDPISPAAKPGNPALKLFVLAAFVSLAAYLFFNYRESLTFTHLATKETSLREYQTANPMLVVGIAFLIYVAITGLSLPGALLTTLVIGWFFGFWQGVILVSFASTTGATIAFLFSRFLLRDTLQAKFGKYLRTFNDALDREGALYLLSLRLIPAVPFWIINLVMGLTPVRTGTFWWVSQIGMLPGTAVFVYAGSVVPSLSEFAEKGTSGILTPKLVAALVLLGVFPLVVKKLMAKFKQSEPTAI